MPYPSGRPAELTAPKSSDLHDAVSVTSNAEDVQAGDSLAGAVVPITAGTIDPRGSTFAHREILWNVHTTLGVVLMYSLFAASVVVAAYGVLRRVRLWSGGLPDNSRLGSWNERYQILWEDVFGQKRVNRDAQTRSFHPAIVAGFFVLLFTTTMVFLAHDLGLTQFYTGRFYLVVTVLSDLFGVFLLYGLARAAHRRYVTHPDRLHNTRADGIVLGALAAMVVQGYLLEALRIHVTRDPWRHFSFVGELISFGMWPLSGQSARLLHYVIWWMHTATVFLFVALIPYTKFFHVFASSANLFFQQLERPKGALRNPGDIEQILEQAGETGEDFKIGITTIQDLSWKQRLDLDACTSCGRCQDACPAYRSGKMLSPKWMILDSRDHMLQLHAKNALDPRPEGPSLLSPLRSLDRSAISRLVVHPRDEGGISDLGEPGFLRARNFLVQESALSVGLDVDAAIAGGVMEEDVFWSCTSCRACVEACPVGIEHVDYIVDVRRSLALMQGSIPSEAQNSLRAIETRGNPFGPAEARADWTSGLDIPIVGPGDEVDVLYWVGCVSAFDKRKQKIARSLATILNASGVRWGILGNRESCTGDPARRLGEENLFQCSAKKNIETLRGVTYQTIVTNCPHCMNSLGNEYGQFGDILREGKARVVHHSVFISELLKAGKLTVAGNIDRLTTFHDPCYLGRYNDTYEEPREVLVKIGGAKKLTEMAESKEKGFCCGAGGGHFFMDMKVGERVNVIRANQAADTGATQVATGCPFCLQMLEDGMKLTDREETHQVRDIAELVCEALVAA